MQHSFRIVEGSTVRVLLRSLAADERLRQEASDWPAEQLAAHLGVNIEGQSSDQLEGLFFPDTYMFSRGDSDLDLLTRAHAAMRKQLQAAWNDKLEGIALANPYELLTLASIVEKETGLAADRGLVSQVFHNRLNDRMRLQTDPTVIYGLGDAFDGNLTRQHLRTANPYNTYMNKGLPPTPIALPSRASLQAAANPIPGDYLYFVAEGMGLVSFPKRWMTTMRQCVDIN